MKERQRSTLGLMKGSYRKKERLKVQKRGFLRCASGNLERRRRAQEKVSDVSKKGVKASTD